jgi:hypothetical protein
MPAFGRDDVERIDDPEADEADARRLARKRWTMVRDLRDEVLRLARWMRWLALAYVILYGFSVFQAM